MGLGTRLLFAFYQLLVLGATMTSDAAGPQQEINITLPVPLPWPAVACTAEELGRLRSAYIGSGVEHRLVADRVKRAQSALDDHVEFPPEGGQHNQWYQCDPCQRALETVDDTHHRCPGCGKVYSGYPYDHVIYSRRHQALTRQMVDCAWAFAVTDEAPFARRTRDILVGYADRYLAYPYHSANMGKRSDKASRSGGHVYEQTLNESSWMVEVCSAYDLVRQSEALSADDHKAIRDRLLIPVYENIRKHPAGKNNWQTYHNSAYMLIGGVLGDEAIVRQALEDPENGFTYQMEESVLPGGMWYENSWGYHFYTLEAVRRIVETGRRLGIDLYVFPQVKTMYTVAADYLMPDGTLPRFGDATTTGIPRERYESAYRQWREPALMALLPDGPTWESVLLGRTERSEASVDTATAASVLQAGAGHAILRGRGPKGTSAAVMTFGPFGGFHGHFDKLSFVYYGLGQELGYDPGRARSQAYRLPVHGNWYRATVSHNTVVVDGASQRGVAANGGLFLAHDQVSAASAWVDDAFEGVTHRRLLVLRPQFLVVADVLNSDDGRIHRFDWLYHNRGTGIVSPSAEEPGDVPQAQGFEYLEDVRQGVTDGPIQATVSLGEGNVDVTVNPHAGSRVLVGTGVGESVTDRVPLVCVSREGTSALFAAVVEPREGFDLGEVEEVTIETHASSGWVIRVAFCCGTEERYVWDPEGQSRMVEGIETQGRLLCQRKEGGERFRKLAESD
jgi:hypothetical protein